MSDLTSSLATLAERLGARPGPPRVPEEIADGASAPGVVDLSGILAMPLDQFAREGQCLEIQVPGTPRRSGSCLTSAMPRR